MFSFLRNGDINNTIRTTITNLPGLYTSDGDKIKYAALNYATAMRHNLHDGAPIFTNIRRSETEIEKRHIQNTGRIVPSIPEMDDDATPSNKRSSPFMDNNIRHDNATLALIMAKEMAFLNRTIQMISLISRRYQEEQEDLEWGRTYTDGDIEESSRSISKNTEGITDEEDDETPEPEPEQEYYEDDSTPSVCPLQRTSSSPTYEYEHRHRGPENQLVATFLIATGRLYRRFNKLCELMNTSNVLVNAMTTQDKPHSEANRNKQNSAERCVISDIYIYFEQFDDEHREPVVTAFMELRDISVACWRLMAMFAFSNLFRLTEGSDFSIYQHDDAIFTQGREYRQVIPQHEVAAAEWNFMKTQTETESTTEAVEDAVEYD